MERKKVLCFQTMSRVVKEGRTDLEDMIDPNHLVRVVNQVIDRTELSVLLKKYKGVGFSSYHPQADAEKKCFIDTLLISIPTIILQLCCFA